MPNNNPNGVNAFSGPNDVQPAYGDIKKLADLTAQAGLAATAQGAPKRAQRKATGSSSRKRVAAAPTPPPGGPQHVPWQQAVANFWQQVASEPGASPLVQELAQAAHA